MHEMPTKAQLARQQRKAKYDKEQVKKGAEPVAILKAPDMALLMNPEEYLTDSHMDAFGRILATVSPYNMQSTLLMNMSRYIQPIPVGTKHLQIVFWPEYSGVIGHWLCAYYDGEIVEIYDSLNNGRLPEAILAYFRCLFPHNPQIVHVQVQRQTNGYDCGLFAIAFSVSVFLERDPRNEQYDVSEMRQHAAEIFDRQQISPFPLNRDFQLQSNYLKRKVDETVEIKAKRLRRIQEYKTEKLANETLEEKTDRLKVLQINSKISVSNETIQTREKRLGVLKQNTKNILKNETHQEKLKRLSVLKQNTENILKNETHQEKQERLNVLKQNTEKIRKNETLKEKQERLELKKIYSQKSVANESLDKREKRLDSNKGRKRSKKEIEQERTYKLATRALQENITVDYLGKMDVRCKSCASVNFQFEQSYDKQFSSCCRKGKLIPDTLEEYPLVMRDYLMDNDGREGKNFKEHIRSYNSALAFASMGAQVSTPPGFGPYVFRVNGQIYHNTSSLYPPNGVPERYAQLYIIDAADALEKRMGIFDRCLPEVMEQLAELLTDINPYCAAFQMLKDVEAAEIEKARQNNTEVPALSLWMHNDREKDKRRYNLPSCNEVAVVFSSKDGEPPANRDICVYPRGQGLVRINQISENCDPMTYPLLFPKGEAGWSLNLKHKDGIRKVTPLQFYMNRIADRKPKFNPILHAGKLTQQYLVDAYVRVESERLSYIRLHQAQLRVELYSGLMDHINNIAANEGGKPGTMIILPSTFQGGSRFMQKMYQNAMAIVREYGKPDLFVTVTCNPKWPEITEQLMQWQNATYRPDIVARVFQGKIKNILHDILQSNVFGKVIAYIYVIEFQKRGLPHMHLLLMLDEADKIRNKDDIDALVSAEVPDREAQPELYEIVKTHMIHGPCGSLNQRSPCMSDGKCSKRYPKDFLAGTVENSNGYPLYRRRNNGATIDIVRKDGSIRYSVDNRWIVPYNPYLSKKYRSHINVEICSSVKSVKYICDYLCKGHDCASIKLGQVDEEKTVNWNEINGYLDARYVSAPEGCWRLLEYPMHDKSHTIVQLAVHMENQQSVVFHPDQVQTAITRAATRNTTLTAWFLLNQCQPEAREFYYSQIPKHYVFTSNNTWRTRQREHQKMPIGRMINVSPRDIERFHLRLLLTVTNGAKSYKDLQTVDGIVYKTFQEAARAKGLLKDNDECDKCLAEAVVDKFPYQLRELFAYLLCFQTTCDAVALWTKFKGDMTEDFLRGNVAQTVAENRALIHIQDIITVHGMTLSNFNLPEPIILDISSAIYNPQVQYDVNVERIEGENNVKLFNAEQQNVLNFVLTAANDPSCKARYFFVDGPGGTGKTFLLNTIISIFRGKGHGVLAVAWTGIAATLLKGGRTVHSTFKLPVPVTDGCTCRVKGNSETARLLREAVLIIWDEITMAPSHALQAIDLLLRDLTDSPEPFGGKIVLLSGDFRQCLPIVKFTNHRTAIIEISVLRSTLWPLFTKIPLIQNMRVNSDEIEFSQFLLSVGNGENDVVSIPQHCLVRDASLADVVFGTEMIRPENVNQIMNRAILSPKNDDTLIINEKVLEKIEGRVEVYYSADSAECDDEDNHIHYPIELLNAQTPTGMPPHKLSLKIGAIVMLLRNMNPKRGLCNGTRLIVRGMKKHILELELATGQCNGERIFLPRIDLSPTDSNLPFILKRRQFPIRLSFSMTINKSQGQTFDFVGINLERPVFTHGQLYVAMSRVRSFANLKIKLDGSNSSTANIVFKEIL